MSPGGTWKLNIPTPTQEEGNRAIEITTALAHSIHTFVASKPLHVKESVISTLVEDIFCERSKFVLIRIVKRSISC